MIAPSQPLQAFASSQRPIGRRNANMSRPQRPAGPRDPPQPRDGESGRCFFSQNASFASRRGDPQPRGGETGRGRCFISSNASSASRRDPQPRDPGNGRRSRGNNDPKPPPTHPRDPGY